MEREGQGNNITSIDIIHESKGKHNSRHGNWMSNLYDKQRDKFNSIYERYSERHEWQSDRPEDKDSN